MSNVWGIHWPTIRVPSGKRVRAPLPVRSLNRLQRKAGGGSGRTITAYGVGAPARASLPWRRKIRCAGGAHEATGGHRAPYRLHRDTAVDGASGRAGAEAEARCSSGRRKRDKPGTWSATRRLAELGWVDGRTIEIVARFADGDFHLVPGLITELVALKPDVLLAHQSGNAGRCGGYANHPNSDRRGRRGAAARACRRSPHPVGNVTGLTLVSHEQHAKVAELLNRRIPALPGSGSSLVRSVQAIEITRLC